MTAAVIETVARVLSDSIVQGCAVALFAAAAIVCLRKHSAAARFGTLLIALASAAVLPLARSVFAGAATPAGASFVHLDDSWALAIAAIWAMIAVLGLGRIAFGLRKLMQLRRACRPFQPSSELRDAVRRFCPSRRVELLASDEVRVPSAIGFFRPAVIMPSWLLEELSPSDLQHVVAHELSHLRRRDDWTNLFQQVVKALLFFHPAVWWIENRLVLEREMACDDAVLVHSPSAREYAECLAHVAERTLLHRGLAMAQAFASRVRQTSRRVARILRFDGKVRKTGKFAMSTAALLIVGSYGVMLQAPELVSFSGNPASNETAAFVQPVAAQQPNHRAHAVNATWHVPSLTTKPALSRAPHVAPADAKAKAAPAATPVLRANVSADELGNATSTVMILVVQDENGFAIWRVTTWQYSPKIQARADRKTT